MLQAIKSLPERWSWIGTAVAVQRRFSELQGGYLASAVIVTAFLALFPLILVSIAIVGFFSSSATDLPGDIIEALGLSPGGDAAESIRDAITQAEESKRAASVIGLVGLLWSGLGLVMAIEYAYNSVWQVQGRGITGRLMGLLWLAGAAVLFILSFGVTAVLGFLPGWLAPLNLAVGLALGVLLFLWTAKVLCNRDVGWRPLIPGAILAGIGFEVLKVVGGIYVPRAVSSSSALYGSIGVVFALLAWLFLFGRLIVYSAVLNVVLWERTHGTVSVEMRVPHLPGHVPLTATRAGATDQEGTAEALPADESAVRSDGEGNGQRSTSGPAEAPADTHARGRSRT